MKPKERVYLIDFDNTLFDTEKLRDLIGKQFAKKYGKNKLHILWETYNKSLKKLKYVDIKYISSKIEKKLKEDCSKEIENLFLKANFAKFTFSHSTLLINLLKKRGKVVLYSLGDTIYQPVKIKGSGIESLIGKSKVFISNNKIKGISSLILELKSKGFNEIFVIDDRADFLETAKSTDPNLITIWFRYGKYKEVLPKNRLNIDFEANTKDALIQYLQFFVTKLPQNSFKENLFVLKGLIENQIKEIVLHTKRDKEIEKYTRDKERFSSRKSFESWEKRGKKIYTMCGRNGNILGIIWFSNTKPPKPIREDLKKFKAIFTFAIRLYKPARHRGLAAKFMNECFKDFFKNQKGTVWLSTRTDNKAAINLYERYGFEKIRESKDKHIYYYYT